MALFETHCHLNHAQFDEDLEQALLRARDADIGRLLVVGYDLASSRRALSLAETHPEIFAAIGIHPEDAGDWTADGRNELTRMGADNADRVIAWGEIGLDYHWKTFDPERQKQVFIQQIAAAQSAGLPIIIHCREAYDDTLDILSECDARDVVLHCFTGTMEQAQRAASCGYYIGVGGIATYKNAEDVRRNGAEMPLDRILLETDSPYLAPQPWRGKRNEPAYITAIAAKVAELRGLTVKEIEDATWANAMRLFFSR